MTHSTEREPTSRPSSRSRAKLLAVVMLVLTVVLAARHLYRSPYSASDLRITPDEVEYAVCARRIATLGRYDLDIDGVSTPPYTTPWFAALLAPVYVVAPGEIGNGIWVVFAMALLGVIVAQRIGVLVSGPLGGALTAIALLAMLPYPYTAHMIMTDGPAMVLGLVGLWLFLRWEPDRARMRESLIAGLLIASAFALRSVYAAMLLPFAWRVLQARERRIVRCAALLLPLVLVMGVNAYYNQTTFGDWRRTGYQLWCAVPYDYPDLVLSPAYFAANLRELSTPVAAQAFALGAAGILALAVRRPPRWKELLGFSAVVALPISALHLYYFHSDLRFHVFLFALCAVLGGTGLGSLVPEKWREHRRSVLAALGALVIAALVMQPFSVQEPTRRQAADAIHAATPDDAVIISGIEPVYLAALAPAGTQRTYLAASRDVEFASKVLVNAKVERELAAPRDAVDHAARGLLAHGGRWAIAHTADEMHAPIDAWVRAGRPVFLETRFLKSLPAVQSMLGTTLRLEDTHARLTRVLAK